MSEVSTGKGEVDRSEKGLRQFPEELLGRVDVRELRLAHNRIRSLPEEIGQLQSLRRLSLAGNPLRALPKGLFSLSHLVELDLGYTLLRALPEEVGTLRKLELLTISSPALATLPKEICRLTNLRILHVSPVALPEDIGALASLEQLEMMGLGTGARRCTRVPESLGRLRKLKTLVLHGGLFASLPHSVASLASLKELNLRNCPNLASLPEGFDALPKLGYISLVEVPSLRRLPWDFSKMKSLEDLHVMEAGLDELPASLGRAPRLKNLIVTKQPSLARLPPELGTLSRLGMIAVERCPKLTNFPFTEAQFKDLTRLSLHHNPCMELPHYFAHYPLQGLEGETKTFVRRFLQRAGRSIQPEQELLRALDDNESLFPFWDDGASDTCVTAAIRAMGFAGPAGVALVFQRFDYDFGQGALGTSAYAYGSFDLDQVLTEIPAREALRVSLPRKLSLLREWRIRIRGRRFVVHVGIADRARYEKVRNWQNEAVPEPAVLAFEAARQLPRDFLFARPEAIRRLLAFPSGTTPVFTVDAWEHWGVEDMADNTKPSQKRALRAMVRAVCAGRAPDRLPGRANTSFEEHWRVL